MAHKQSVETTINLPISFRDTLYFYIVYPYLNSTTSAIAGSHYTVQTKTMSSLTTYTTANNLDYYVLCIGAI